MTADRKFYFSSIPVPERESKPRRKGLTMMIDWGLPLHFQQDLMTAQGIYIDEAKIAAGIPRVMPAEYLKAKIDAYRKADVSIFPGGLFAELAIAQGNYDHFLEEARDAGFSAIEVSDNLISIDAEKKKRCIRRAVEDFGLVVMGEVGRKEGGMSSEAIIADVENCLEAGASGVLLEAHELFHGDIRQDTIDSLAARVSLEKIWFELPVVVLPDTTKDYKVKAAAWLVKTFGTDVNLANVEWDEIYFTEIVRRGMAGDTSHPNGAYRIAGIEGMAD